MSDSKEPWSLAGGGGGPAAPLLVESESWHLSRALTPGRADTVTEASLRYLRTRETVSFFNYSDRTSGSKSLLPPGPGRESGRLRPFVFTIVIIRSLNHFSLFPALEAVDGPTLTLFKARTGTGGKTELRPRRGDAPPNTVGTVFKNKFHHKFLRTAVSISRQHGF